MNPKPGKYQHYKGKFYEFVCLALDSDNLEEMVIYKGLYDDPKFDKNPVWVRPKNEFLGKVVVDGKEVERFKFIE